MGVNQLSLLELFSASGLAPDMVPSKTIHRQMKDRGGMTLSLPVVKEALICDSACSGTALATGHATTNETVGLDETGQKLINLFEAARSQKKSIGMITDCHLTDATPAAFMAHQSSRSQLEDIAEDIIQLRPDILLGGGLAYFIPKDPADHKEYLKGLQLKNKMLGNLDTGRSDQKDLLFDAAENQVTLVSDKHSLKDAQTLPLYGFFSMQRLPDAISRYQNQWNPYYPVPTNSEMVKKALKLLSRNKQGFVLVVEFGQIDVACHQNDAGALLFNLIEMERTLESCFKFARKHSNTLLVVTADHETGGFAFSFSSKNNTSLKPLLELSSKPDLLVSGHHDYGQMSLISQLFNQQSSILDIIHRFKKKCSELKVHSEDYPAKQELLTEEIKLATGIEITDEQAMYILKVPPAFLSDVSFPTDHSSFYHHPGFKEFYITEESRVCARVSKVLGTYMNITWASGTHTHSMVPLYFMGPKHLIPKFKNVNTHPEIGKLLMECVTGRASE